VQRTRASGLEARNGVGHEWVTEFESYRTRTCCICRGCRICASTAAKALKVCVTARSCGGRGDAPVLPSWGSLCSHSRPSFVFDLGLSVAWKPEVRTWVRSTTQHYPMTLRKPWFPTANYCRWTWDSPPAPPRPRTTLASYSIAIMRQLCQARPIVLFA
jgi:hypothetical protein